jgi:hypothetical protein
VVELYNENRDWIDIWPDQGYANTVRVMAADSLLRIGLKDKAQEMYDNISPAITSEYAGLSYALCRKQVLYDINRLPAADFQNVLNEAKDCGTDYLLYIISLYKNKQIALKAEYNLLQGIEDVPRREEIQNDIYKQVQAGARFDGYEDIYIDVGLAAYRRNDFSGALIPLKTYADIATVPADKKTAALYYLGKSFLSLNEQNTGLSYMQQVADSDGDSVYKTMAKSELASDAWKKSLNN